MIPQDKLEKFERGEIEMEAFTDAEKAELEKLMSGEDVEVKAPADIPAVKDDLSTETPVVVADEEIPKDHVPGAKYKEKADQANDYRQKADSYSKQLEETRAELDRIKEQSAFQPAQTVTPDVVWSDKHQLDLVAEVARLKGIVENGVRGSQDRLQKLEKELADKNMFASLNAFASEFAELRLSRPFEEANAEYIQFTQKLGATPSDLSVVDKYFEDAAFRREKEALGIKPPKDYDRLEKILKVYHEQGKYPTLRAAYLDKFLTADELEKRLSGRYLQGVDDAVTQIAQRRNETTILEPGQSSDKGFAMTEAQMEAWMNANPYPVTPNQKATMAQIQTYLQAQAGRQK